MTAPKVISWADVQVDLLAEVPVRKPVFVGIANSVDVENYVGKTQRLEVTGFETPWTVRTHEVKGRGNLPGAPTTSTGGSRQSAGLGGASISTQLPDETVSGGGPLGRLDDNLSGVEISLGVRHQGRLLQGASPCCCSGLAAVWSGWWSADAGLWLAGPYDEEGPIIEEEVVYVYVDEDGVEHEMSAEEAQEYDVVDESVEIVEAEPVDVGPEPKVEPAVPQPEGSHARIPGVLTAAEIAAGAEPEPCPSLSLSLSPYRSRNPSPCPSPSRSRNRNRNPHRSRPVSAWFTSSSTRTAWSTRWGEDELGDFEIVDDEEEP